MRVTDGPGGPLISDNEVMKPDCDICGGSGKVMLPVNRDRQRRRKYPCPECAKPEYPGQKFTVLVARRTCDAAFAQREPRYTEHMEGEMAARLAMAAVKAGLILFEEVPNPGEMPGRDLVVEARIGAVWPKGQVFESRVDASDPEAYGLRPSRINLGTYGNPTRSDRPPVDVRKLAKQLNNRGAPGNRDLILFEEPDDAEDE